MSISTLKRSGSRVVAGIAALTLSTAGLVVLGMGAAAAAPARVCPHSDGWLKVDLTEDGITSLTLTAPEGMVIVETCVKAATEIAFTVLEPGQVSVVLETPAANGRGIPQAISHYAYRVAPDDIVPQ